VDWDEVDGVKQGSCMVPESELGGLG